MNFQYLLRSKSSTDLTQVDGFGKQLNIVFKNTRGGMQETTLNSTITELFPAIAFEAGIKTNLEPAVFYNKLVVPHCLHNNYGHHNPS